MAEETPRNEPSESPDVDIDLASLNDLALGPRWSSGPVRDNVPKPSFRDERDQGPRTPRPGGQAPRRDRRPQRSKSEGVAEPAPSGDRPARAERPQHDSRDSRAPRRDFRPPPPPPPFKPIVEVALYPEENPFKLLCNAIKNSARTYELFEIARLILEKPERFVVVAHPIPETQPATIFVSVPDNIPFETEDAALSHVFATHADMFLVVEEVEVDPPKGNFQIVNRCGITGELLGPPNYHRYQQIVQNHFATRISNIPYERFLSRIEGVREKEVIDQWVDKMRKQTRFRLKEPIEGAPSEFDSLESVRFHLVLHAKEKLVRAVQNARFEGRLIEQMPAGAIRQSVEAVLELQRRFPLDTANNLRGRLRRMGFSVYKKGSKGISYVCAIRRAFRKPGESFGESVQQLIEFVEAHPGFPASDLPKEYLGTEIPEAGESAMPPEDLERLRLLRNDLRWLITSGYVTEYSNGKLFAPPPQSGATASDDGDSSSEEEAAPVVEADAAPVAEVTPEAAPAAVVETAPVEEVTPEAAPAAKVEAVTEAAEISEPQAETTEENPAGSVG
ncbi:MAG: hypothetical protein WC360_04540 [Opitutales bacterium]|jgi:hypothetical protein